MHDLHQPIYESLVFGVVLVEGFHAFGRGSLSLDQLLKRARDAAHGGGRPAVAAAHEGPN